MMERTIPSRPRRRSVNGLPFRPHLLLALAPLLLVGCASMRPTTQCASPCPSCVGSNRVLFVADGAGDYGTTTANVRQVVREQKLAWCVEKVVWSHGKLRVYADQTDLANSRAA